MRGPRIKDEGTAYYHMLSRVVDRRMVFDHAEKERIRSKTSYWRSPDDGGFAGLFTARRLRLDVITIPATG